MKIYFLYYAYEVNISGDIGGFRKLWELADNLEKQGHQVRIFFPKLPNHFPLKAIPYTFYPLFNFSPLRAVSAYLSMFFYALILGVKESPNIIYFRTSANIFPVILGKSIGAKVVLEVNGSFREFHKTIKVSYLRNFIFSITERFNVYFSNKVITLTPGLKDLLLRHYKVNPDKIEVITSGTDTEHFFPRDSRESKKGIGLDQNHPVVGFAGIFYPHQGVDTLIYSARQVAKSHPKVLFLLVGSGNMEKKWKELVRAEGVEGLFVFPGQVAYKKMPVYFNAMDIFVAPFSSSRGETSPLKVLDALACGKIVVASAIPAMNSLAKEFNGPIILVEPDNSAELAKIISGLLSDDGKKKRLTEGARETILKKYSWEIIANQVADTLKAIS